MQNMALPKSHSRILSISQIPWNASTLCTWTDIIRSHINSNFKDRFMPCYSLQLSTPLFYCIVIKKKFLKQHSTNTSSCPCLAAILASSFTDVVYLPWTGTSWSLALKVKKVISHFHCQLLGTHDRWQTVFFLPSTANRLVA